MTRQLKFRAWHPEWKKLIYFNNLYLTSEHFRYNLYAEEEGRTCFHWFCAEEVFIQQFTGLKDKNYKEIYEGDLILVSGRDTSPERSKNIYQVIWDEKSLGFRFVNSEKGRGFNNSDNYYCSYEIIGNILENPDLVKYHYE